MAVEVIISGWHEYDIPELMDMLGIEDEQEIERIWERWDEEGDEAFFGIFGGIDEESRIKVGEVLDKYKTEWYYYTGDGPFHGWYTGSFIAWFTAETEEEAERIAKKIVDELNSIIGVEADYEIEEVNKI